MPSLRELFEAIPKVFRDDAAYDLLEALVEAVEAQENDDLRKERDGWEQGCWQAEQELAEAKAALEAWMRRCQKLERLLAVQKASIADAEIGRLVRGMKWGSKFSVHGYDLSIPEYMSFCWDAAQDGYRLLKQTKDPAEALRAIQKEVGDGEA